MKATEQELKQAKIYFALQGNGSKGRVAKQIGVAKSQISLFLTTGHLNDHAMKKLLKLIVNNK